MRDKEKRKNCIWLLFPVMLLLTCGMRTEAASAGYREFLNDNNRPEADYSNDNREVFHIIEVIPHDACSIFPYLIDWKTEEEYNRNIPIGYDGLIYGSSHTGSVQIFEGGESKPGKAYGVVEDGIKRDFLGNYNVTFTTKNTKNTGHWWRETDISEKKKENGYFEYVGDGKGLYYINTESIKGEKGEKNGISYEIQALPRSKNEEGKGEYAVKDAGYYWAEDYSGQRAYPMKDTASRTGFNYDLAFHYRKGTGTYRVYGVTVQKEEERTGGGILGGNGGSDNITKGSYDYFAKVEEGTEGKYTFEKCRDGNYIKKGEVYVYAGVGKGSYIPERESLIIGKEWAVQAEITFEYAGEGKGIYDVSFIYAGSSGSSTAAKYTASVEKVTNSMGRYALTSTSRMTDKTGVIVPVYEEKAGGDYSQVIVRIDFAGIDYVDEKNGYYATNAPYGAGVRIGRTVSDYGTEMGGWIFHELTDISDKEYTKLKDVKGKKSFVEGDRIYVSGQNRIYRYYCRNSFRNNEWFKLMCYLDNPGDASLAYSDNSNGMGYDMNLTSSENLIKAKKLLTGFDNTFRIDVRQRTPGELTKEEVEHADLIYISDAAGIESLVGEWDNISTYLQQNGQTALSPLPAGVGNYGDFRFEDDLSNEALLAIYDRCIYKNEGALMVTVGLREHYMQSNYYDLAVKNLGKLTFFMDLMTDAHDFAYFIEGYEESAESNFNLIHQNTTGSVLTIEVWPKKKAHDKYGAYVEMYNVSREGESGMDGCFHITHFEVPEESEIPISWKGSEYTGHSSVGQVLEGETKYYSHWYSVSSFNADELHKVWQILHNRKNKGKIVVQITNAHLTFGMDKKRIIYADEFDPSTFDVKYKILLRGAIVETAPPLGDTIIFFDDNDNGIYDAGELCYTNTGQKYNIEDDAHVRNVRGGFEDAGSITDPKLLNPDMVLRKVIVQAMDINGKTGSTDVWVTVREGFDLN